MIIFVSIDINSPHPTLRWSLDIASWQVTSDMCLCCLCLLLLVIVEVNIIVVLVVMLCKVIFGVKNEEKPSTEHIVSLVLTEALSNYG